MADRNCRDPKHLLDLVGYIVERLSLPVSNVVDNFLGRDVLLLFCLRTQLAVTH